MSSDHRIVTAKIRLSLRRNAAWTTTTVLNEWSLFNNRDIRDKYTLTVRNKFDALQEISETPTPNDEYENFVTTHLETAVECIPTKQRAKPKAPRETLGVRKKRAVVKIASLRYKRNPTNINTQKLKEPPKVTYEPITKIIDNQLDIKLGQFTQEELDSVLRKIKNRKAAGLDEIPQKYERPGNSTTYCSDIVIHYITKTQ